MNNNYDVIIVGTGAAGLFAGLCLPADLKVLMITKDMKIGEVVNNDIAKSEIFMDFGMFCVGCPSAQGESIEEAALGHGIDLDALLEALNK